MTAQTSGGPLEISFDDEEYCCPYHGDMSTEDLAIPVDGEDRYRVLGENLSYHVCIPCFEMVVRGTSLSSEQAIIVTAEAKMTDSPNIFEVVDELDGHYDPIDRGDIGPKRDIAFSDLDGGGML